MLFDPVGGSLWELHSLSPTKFPAAVPWVAIATSVTVPPLASDRKSIPSSSLLSGNHTHSHGPSILGPPFGKAGLSNQTSLIFSRNPSRGEMSEMLFLEICSHFKLVNPASGDISDMSL